MKRYYTSEGEPDEAKTLWEAVKTGIIGISAFSVICILWDGQTVPPTPDSEPHWKNWDKSRHVSEVKSYDYENGIIHYRDEVTGYRPKELNLYGSSSSNYGSGITLQVSGASVHLDMEVEELMDQLTEDVDFYEYFERNMD
jgi:hypothetical protein